MLRRHLANGPFSEVRNDILWEKVTSREIIAAMVAEAHEPKLDKQMFIDHLKTLTLTVQTEGTLSYARAPGTHATARRVCFRGFHLAMKRFKKRVTYASVAHRDNISLACKNSHWLLATARFAN